MTNEAMSKIPSYERRCSRCDEVKALSEFPKDRTRIRTVCKQCDNKRRGGRRDLAESRQLVNAYLAVPDHDGWWTKTDVIDWWGKPREDGKPFPGGSVTDVANRMAKLGYLDTRVEPNQKGRKPLRSFRKAACMDGDMAVSGESVRPLLGWGYAGSKTRINP